MNLEQPSAAEIEELLIKVFGEIQVIESNEHIYYCKVDGASFLTTDKELDKSYAMQNKYPEHYLKIKTMYKCYNYFKDKLKNHL